MIRYDCPYAAPSDNGALVYFDDVKELEEGNHFLHAENERLTRLLEQYSQTKTIDGA